MPKVSVLMSVYNESESDLLLAVNSIIKQSFKDFEFIIVCDNPDNVEIVELLHRIEKMDERIKIVWNPKNVGLALSLNNAFQVSSGEYIARMDADDISVNNRLEIEINAMKSGNYDLVWSSYDFINEVGENIVENVDYYEDCSVNLMLQIKNIIHHPTVMMKRTSFQEAGLYRNFPCAQDYDLWLRLLTNNCKMHMLEEVLLHYRVRASSVTSTKKYQQLATLNYIRKLYKMRCKYGVDNYSYINYQTEMTKVGVGNRKVEEAFLKSNEKIKIAKEAYKRHRYWVTLINFIQAYCGSKLYRRQFLIFINRKWRSYISKHR